MGPVLLHHISSIDAVVLGVGEQVEGVRGGVCDTVGGGDSADAECAASGREHHLLPELERVGVLPVSAGRKRAGVPGEQHKVVSEPGGACGVGVELVGGIPVREHSSTVESEGAGRVPGAVAVHHSGVSCVGEQLKEEGTFWVVCRSWSRDVGHCVAVGDREHGRYLMYVRFQL